MNIRQADNNNTVIGTVSDDKLYYIYLGTTASDRYKTATLEDGGQITKEFGGKYESVPFGNQSFNEGAGFSNIAPNIDNPGLRNDGDGNILMLGIPIVQNRNCPFEGAHGGADNGLLKFGDPNNPNEQTGLLGFFDPNPNLDATVGQSIAHVGMHDEIMTSFYEPFDHDHADQGGNLTDNSHPLSSITLGFLTDLGYILEGLDHADEFTLVSENVNRCVFSQVEGG